MIVDHKITISIISALHSNTTFISNNNNSNIELYGEIKIKVNRRFFNLIMVINKYVKIFTFGEDGLQV